MSPNPPLCQLPLVPLLQIYDYLAVDIVTLSALSQVCHAPHSHLCPFINSYFHGYYPITFPSACKRGLFFTVRRCIALSRDAYREPFDHRRLLLFTFAAYGHALVLLRIFQDKLYSPRMSANPSPNDTGNKVKVRRPLYLDISIPDTRTVGRAPHSWRVTQVSMPIPQPAPHRYHPRHQSGVHHDCGEVK
ncbi:hypothetical protein DFP73DRAFT_530108 [Morchella snyderi]|nr:hypothetical protein DFP73DRAFT_530108 [Morchella snyderi]